MNICENINSSPEKINFPLAFRLDKCHNDCARFLLRTGCAGGGLHVGRHGHRHGVRGVLQLPQYGSFQLGQQSGLQPREVYHVVSHCGMPSPRNGERRRGNGRTGRGSGRRKGERATPYLAANPHYSGSCSLSPKNFGWRRITTSINAAIFASCSRRSVMTELMPRTSSAA